jgi:putative membrane protein
MEKKNQKPLELIWKGALFGVANIIPGVSGGTLAVITGVYDQFMEAIGHFVKHWKFLFFYMIGAGIGIVGGSFSLETLFERWPAPTLFCFMGFILGGLPLLWKRSTLSLKGSKSWIIGFLISFTLVVLMRFLLNPTETEPMRDVNLSVAIAIFLSGAAAASAMVVPGISGSFLLLLFGMYTTYVTAITEMNFIIIIVAGLGIVAGLLVTARVITFFLERFHKGTYGVILGLVCGSVIALWPGVPEGLQILAAVLTFAGGLAGGYLLGDK